MEQLCLQPNDFIYSSIESIERAYQDYPPTKDTFAEDIQLIKNHERLVDNSVLVVLEV